MHIPYPHQAHNHKQTDMRAQNVADPRADNVASYENDHVSEEPDVSLG